MAQALSSMSIASEPMEDIATRSVENVTVKLPSIGFLGLAVASMAASAYLEFLFLTFLKKLLLLKPYLLQIQFLHYRLTTVRS